MNRRRIALAASVLIAVLISAVPVFADIAVVDGLGRRVDSSVPARRVVSLSPAATEVLFAVGADAEVAAVTSYCDYPAAASSKPRIGGFSGKSVSIETIIALSPDLVVVEGGMHQVVMGLLEKASLRCYACQASTLEDAYRIIRDLGTLTGHGAEGARVASIMKSRIDGVRSRVAGLAKPSAFWEVWDDPLMTSGRNTFITEAIEAAGGRNVFSDVGEQWPAVSAEIVLEKDPDWLLSSSDRGDRMSVKNLSARPGWKNLSAVRTSRIALIDADSVNRAGPRLADAVEALARVFHPEAFR